MDQLHILKEIPGKQIFHSAFLTCYSVDFYFLEQRMVSMLRTKGVRNIAVVADARMIEESIAKLACNIKKASSLYSVSTILTNGAYHPKIYMLVGSNAVVAVLGSGNITSGGFGKNHELFTYLYADEQNLLHMPLISQIWSYLRSTCKDFQGITKRQIEWMEEHCDLDLNTNRASIGNDLTEVAEDMSVCFLNSDKAPIADQLFNLIENKERISKITVLSPYFDESGLFLHTLCEKFPKAKIDVVIQPDQALLPIKMEPHERVSFFDWKDTSISKDLSFSIPRFVHAKLLHFTNGETEYLLLGSANATNRAFMYTSKANKEAVLVFKGDNKNWLRKLGIDGYKKSIPLPSVSKAPKRNSLSENPVSFQYKIYNVDVKSMEYTIYMNDVPPNDAILTFFTSDGQTAHTEASVKTIDGFIKGSFDRSVNVRSITYACFYKNSLQISNKQIVNDEYSLWSNNPSPENRRILYLLDRISEDSYSTLDIYDFYDVLNGEIRNTKRSSAANTAPQIEVAEHTGPSYLEVLKAVEEGTYVSGNETPNRVFSTYLDRLAKELNMREETEIDDEEDGDINTGNRREQKEIKAKSFTSYKAFEREKSKFSRFHERYAEHLLYYDSETYQTGLTDYAMFLLCISHLLGNAGKSYTYNDATVSQTEVLVPYMGPVHEYTSLNAVGINIIGKFLCFLNYYKDEKQYPNEYDSMRLKYFKKLTFGKILISLAMLHQKCQKYWNQFEKWHLLIALNCIDKFDYEDFDISTDIQKQIKLFNVQDIRGDTAIEYLSDLLRRAKKVYHQVMNRDIYENTADGRIVYIQEVGFC